MFERLAYNQLYEYMCQNKLIYKYQSGFRPSFSTNTALTYLTDRIRFNMDKGMYTGVVLLDLRKAFDTVNHDILLTKLDTLGLCNKSVAWFRSYLSNRKQFVEINGVQSSSEPMNCGVPQLWIPYCSPYM